jgi:hypothetical protein
MCVRIAYLPLTNVWMPDLIFMKLGVYILAPGPTSTAYFFLVDVITELAFMSVYGWHNSEKQITLRISDCIIKANWGAIYKSEGHWIFQLT